MNVIKKVLPSGLRVIMIPEDDAMATTVLVLVEAGSKYETKEINGLSHFLEHMCFKGTTNRPKSLLISSELDSLGAQFNAFTSHEYTGYYAKVQPAHAIKALDIVADLYLNPLFDAAEVEKEKGVIIEEINMYEDLPHRKVGELLMELMYGDQPAGWAVTGPRETILKLTRDDFVQYRKAHYVASSTVVIVSGKFDEEAIFAKISADFSTLSTGEKAGKLAVKETQQAPSAFVRHKASDQTHLVIGIRSYPLLHKDRHVLEVLAGILGGGMSSRLFERVREKMGAAYYVRANQDSYTDHGIFEIAAGVDHRKLESVIEAIVEEIRRLKDETVTPAELQRVKDSITGHLYLGLEKSDEIALFYGGQEILQKKYEHPEDMTAGIQAVTQDDVRRVANEIFKKESANIALIGPYNDNSTFARKLELV